MSVHDKCRCVYVMSVKVREREGKGEGGRRVYRSGREVSVKVKRRLCQNPAGREHVPSCTRACDCTHTRVLATVHIHAPHTHVCLRARTSLHPEAAQATCAQRCPRLHYSLLTLCPAAY